MKNILITGIPQSGKTMLLRKLATVFKEFNATGFYTQEIVKDGARVGFEMFNLSGDGRVIAHTDFKSKVAVGRFKVDVKTFEKFMEEILGDEKKVNIYFVDEIGKMECFSKKFSKKIVELLNSEKPVIATISEKGTGLIADIKKRSDVRLIEINPVNRDLKLKELTLLIRDLLIE